MTDINSIKVNRVSDQTEHTLSRELKNIGYIDVYQEYSLGVQLKLLHKDDKETGAKKLTSVTLGLDSKKAVTNALIKFSPGPKSKYLALYLKELKSLRILKIDQNIESTFKRYKAAQNQLMENLRKFNEKPKLNKDLLNRTDPN